MRLLFLIENTLPHASGGGYYAIFRFAEFLAARGHDVLVYAVHDLGWIRTEGRLRLVIRPHVPRSNALFRKLDKIVDRLTDRTHLEGLARTFRPDWVLGVFRESAIKAVDLGQKLGVPVANFVYECPLWLQEVGGERFTSKYHGYLRSLWERTRAAYLRSDILFPNSELSGEYMNRWLDGKAVAEPIYPGLDEADIAAADPVGEKKSIPSLLYVGRLAPLKNVDLLVGAVQECSFPVRCHICGDGPEKQRLMDMASGDERFVFHGFVSDARMWSLIAQCDALVYPTSFEGFGMPPMQAFYCGKPCIASDIPILRSIYGDHIDYFLHGDRKDLLRRIEQLLRDPEYRRQRGEAGRAFVSERFTWKSAAERVEANLLAFTPEATAAR